MESSKGVSKQHSKDSCMPCDRQQGILRCSHPKLQFAVHFSRASPDDYYAIARETIDKQGVLVFWVNNLRMAADALTKLKGDTRPLFEILEGGTFLIKLCLESGRKETAKQKEPSPQQQ